MRLRFDRPISRMRHLFMRRSFSCWFLIGYILMQETTWLFFLCLHVTSLPPFSFRFWFFVSYSSSLSWCPFVSSSLSLLHFLFYPSSASAAPGVSFVFYPCFFSFLVFYVFMSSSVSSVVFLAVFFLSLLLNSLISFQLFVFFCSIFLCHFLSSLFLSCCLFVCSPRSSFCFKQRERKRAREREPPTSIIQPHSANSWQALNDTSSVTTDIINMCHEPTWIK